MTRRGQRSAPVDSIEKALARSKLRRIGLLLVCAKVAMVPVIFDPASEIPFAVVKDVVSHALAYALVAVIAALFIQFGRSIFVWSTLHVPVLAFLAVSIVATVFAADPILALYGARGRMLGLATIADGVVLYFGIILLVRNRAEALWILASTFGGSVVVLGYELVQYANRDPFHWDISGALRPFSTIGQTTNLAEYLSALALGAVALALLDVQLSRNIRISLIALACALIVGIIPTLVRSAFLGIGAGVALLLLLTWQLHPSRIARRLTFAGALAATAVLAVIVFFTPLGARLLNTVEISASADTPDESGPRLEQSADVRIALYQIAFDMVRERPLLGYGPDNFSVGMPTYRPAPAPQEVSQGLTTSAHSWVTQVASGSGVLGLLAFSSAALLALWLTFRAGFRSLAWTAATILVTFLAAGLTTVNGIATDWVFWASLGLVGATTLAPKPPLPAAEPASKPTRNRRPLPVQPQWTVRRVAAIGAVAIGVLMMFTPINALAASHSSLASTRLRLSNQPEQAVAAALQATRADPLRAQYWDTLGLAYVSGDHLSDAASAFAQANKLAPYDVRFHGDLARVYVLMYQRGDKSAGPRAHEVGDRAVQVDPNNPLAQHTRAVAMQVTGDLSEALKSVERAIELDRYNNQGLYVTATQILVSIGRPADAVAMALRGIDIVPDVRNQIPIRTELVRALAANGQLSEALVAAQAILAIQPGEPNAQKLVAQIQAAMGK